MIQTRIVCDRCGILGVSEGGKGRKAAHILREQLKGKGWLVGQPYALDFCPKCREIKRVRAV